jgi:hypothetical protein
MLNALLWLFVINLGIVVGAGLYESRITVPQWIRFSPESGYLWNAAAAREADVGRRFWAFVSTVPLTLLTLASLAAAWSAHGPVRPWWLLAAAAALADRIMTGAYFIPTMIKLTSSHPLPEARVVSMGLRWKRAGYLRLATVMVAWLAALKALSLLSIHN